jgi:lysophospholipid hydrolase
MSRLLGDLEESHRLTVYQTDQKFTWWTKLCIQQSDCVLLVVNAKQAPECAHLERYLAWAYKKFLVRHVQVLVLQQVEHDDNSSIEKRIPISHALSEWIESRNFIEGQHVVRRPIKGYEKDVARMCRRITGRSLGLALGGGGARGLAHVGVIRALMERGVSVDICGGTSQGAFVGGKCFVLITLCTRQQ